jgi:hypothetical protein
VSTTEFRRARQMSAHTVHLLFVRERGIRSEYAELLLPRRVPRHGAA